ncbi:MAG: hypothetical protein VYD19_09010, partial [Myxococcota bacterium]|nr:hypothetical protein [Myxococcota bacterium]
DTDTDLEWSLSPHQHSASLRISESALRRWTKSAPESYLSRLAEAGLETEALQKVADILWTLRGRRVPWRYEWRLITLRRAST